VICESGLQRWQMAQKNASQNLQLTMNERNLNIIKISGVWISFYALVEFALKKRNVSFKTRGLLRSLINSCVISFYSLNGGIPVLRSHFNGTYNDKENRNHVGFFTGLPLDNAPDSSQSSLTFTETMVLNLTSYLFHDWFTLVLANGKTPIDSVVHHFMVHCLFFCLFEFYYYFILIDLIDL
jgi:hypothetical protein